MALRAASIFKPPLPAASTRMKSSGATVGVIYNAAASLSGNKIRNNLTGVQANVATQATAFGFVAPPTGSLVPNEIYANTLGVARWLARCSGKIFITTRRACRAPALWWRSTSSTPTSLNRTAQASTSPARFSSTGLPAMEWESPRSDQLIAHNLIYRNTTVGIQISGDTDVRITSNTLHSPIGDLIRVESGEGSPDHQQYLLGQTGYDIYIDNSSQSGFWSDYNILHASGTGKLLMERLRLYGRPRRQADVAKFDLHLRGRTSVNPTWSEPHFRNMGLDDYRTSDLTAGVRFSNPAIDAGDPLSDLVLASAPPNLLTNGSFETVLPAGQRTSPLAPTPARSRSRARAFTAGAAVAGFAEQTVNLLTTGFTVAELDSRPWLRSAAVSARRRSCSPTSAS